MSEPPVYPQPQESWGMYPGRAPEHPRANLTLVLGLIGLVGGIVFTLPLLVAPVAWLTGRRVLAEIDASEGSLDGRSKAQSGYVLGIVGTVLLILFAAFLVGLLIWFIVAISPLFVAFSANG